MVLGFPIAALLVPFLVAFGVSGLLRRRGKRWTGLGAAGLGLGAFAGYVALSGALPFGATPPHHRVGQALAVLTAAGGIAGLLGDRIARWRAVAAWTALAAVAWAIGFDRLDLLEADDLFLAGFAAACGIVIMLRLAALADAGATPVAVAGIAAAGLSVIAWRAHAGTTAGLALALAAAASGWLSWARPLPRAAAGAASLVAGGSLIAIAVETAHTALEPPWAILALLGCFFPEQVLRFVPGASRLARRKSARPLALILAALPPALVAAAAAFLLGLGRTAS
jgi:hypothetical protein